MPVKAFPTAYILLKEGSATALEAEIQEKLLTQRRIIVYYCPSNHGTGKTYSFIVPGSRGFF